MIIGVPKEIKTREYRVGMTPAGVRSFVAQGHRVLVQAHERAGATIVPSAADAWGAEMVVKVKEPLPTEFGYFRQGLSHTSTWALTNTTLKYGLAIANKGIVAAAKADRAVLLGVNTFGGGVTYGPVAQAHNLEYVPVEKALG